MASYSNRWAPKRTSRPPKHSFGSGRAIATLALAALGAAVVWKLAKPSSSIPSPLPSTSQPLPLGTSG